MQKSNNFIVINISLLLNDLQNQNSLGNKMQTSVNHAFLV